ncbi:hypothetical protein DAI22_01g157800 [Oryza sativa Japonica Group]|nr:hypothetical protein DAI22_01g157800 [Oryza sativa Japonica Group]
MPRAKTPMGLIPFPKKRAATFARRKETVMKMAKELSVLCDAQVAVVVGNPGGGAAEKAAWESEEGVRAKRSLTHREYLRGELRKQRAKLAKVREEGAFKPWDDALDGIAEEETRKLHKYLSDKIEAARARMEAMGLQLGDVDDNGVNGDDGGGLDLQQHVPPSASDAKEFESVPVVHGGQYIGSSSGGGGGDIQMQTTPAADGISFAEQYPQAVQPEHGIQYNAPMEGYPSQVPGNGLPDLATGSIDVAAAAATTAPARYPPTLDTGRHGSFLVAPRAQPLAFSTAGADFINAPNNFLTTGVSVSDYSVQSSGYGIGNQIDNAKQLLYQMQMQYPVGGTGGAEPSNTQTQSPDLRSFSNVVGDYSYTAAQSSANRLDQMHHPVGGRGSTGGAAADPSDTQSKNRGS